ncbi:hypothetical protein LEL_10784 [Akanthomyces lecanii RCEF 1005]|uniref:Uncharacterized protein n=1 Tax=Akanthomyces lecanii RCEF 1005 TaxID=1081108 RepID=A0A167TSM9_CORDF|nr:hypothetical protein LEL_10784 [Akanthomyces lecanii RCEF 1005]
MADEGGSQDEGDVLDDDESRSVDSDSTGSLADFIAPDWEMADGEGFLAVEDDDYEDEGSTDKDETDDDGDGDYDDDRDDGDDRDVYACSPDNYDAPSSYSSPVERIRDTIPRLQILLYRLRRLAREFEPETDQRALLHRHRSRYCSRRRGRRTNWVPPPLQRAGGSMVLAPHNNAESDASPLSPKWRRKRRRGRGCPVD